MLEVARDYRNDIIYSRPVNWKVNTRSKRELHAFEQAFGPVENGFDFQRPLAANELR